MISPPEPPTGGEAEAGHAEGAEGATFAGDRGQLPLDARRVLVQLLLGPSVDARRQTRLWPVLLRDEAALRSRLHELFLDLVIDHEQQVAFTRQVVSQEIDVPILLRKASPTLKLLFPAEEIQQLTRLYVALTAAGHEPGNSPGDERAAAEDGEEAA